MSVERWAKMIMLVAVAAATGCGAGQSPWAGRQARRDSGPTPPSMVARSSSSDLFSRGQAAEPSTTERITQAVSNTIRRAGDAMTIEPKVVRASDPTSLASATTPVSVDLFLAAARVSQAQNQTDRAIQQYKLALQADPHHRNALIGYARLLDRAGKVAQAEAIYRRAVDAHGEDAVVYNDLGMFYAKRQLFEESLSALAVAVRIAPKEKRYRNNIATVLVQQNRANEAYVHLAAVHSESIAHYNLGVLFQHNSQPEMAMHQFQTALQSDPSMQEARDRLASSRNVSTTRSLDVAVRPPALARPTPVVETWPVSLRPSEAALRYPAINQGSSLSPRIAPTPSETPSSGQHAAIIKVVEWPPLYGTVRQASYTTDVIRQPRAFSSVNDEGALAAPLPSFHPVVQ